VFNVIAMPALMHSCYYVLNDFLNVLNKAGIFHHLRITTMKRNIYFKNETPTVYIIPYICMDIKKHYCNEIIDP